MGCGLWFGLGVLELLNPCVLGTHTINFKLLLESFAVYNYTVAFVLGGVLSLADLTRCLKEIIL